MADRPSGGPVDGDVVGWLLDADPALRWQVERDVVHAPPSVWRATRARVATEGFGARLLGHQDPDGQWAGGAYFPADVGGDGAAPPDAEGRPEEGQPWTATTWSLVALREWGLDPEVLRARRTPELLAEHCRWEYDDLPYWGGEVDWCINGYTLAAGAWLGVDVTGLLRTVLDGRLPDGGWNCAWVEGATVSSYHSTLNALKGLLAYQEHAGATDELRAARRAGEEYLLRRGLFRRLGTGEPVGDWAFRLAYPFRWYYSVLNALVYLRAASLLDGTPPDPRAAGAGAHGRRARRPVRPEVHGPRPPGRGWV
ncbi:MAG: squalene cyclase, partial [Cellulosimicrobium funkei]